MKKKTTYGFGTKLILIVMFICGLIMVFDFVYLFEETEEIEGIVEHTYISSKKGSIDSPRCRVVWYDKNGEKVVYGMPNDKGYEVGDSYFIKVDVDSNRIPERTVGEVSIVGIVGLIICVVCVVNWRSKFGTVKIKQPKRMSAIEMKRREVYNSKDYLPIVKCSICNGEQVAGFKDRKTGHFTEVMLIQKEEDLEFFKKRYGLDEVKKEY